MTYRLQQNQTTQVLLFLMLDSADHVSPKTGLSPTVTLSKAGGAFASPAGAVTEVGSGWYKVAGNATDANTLGPLILHATGTGADPVDTVFHVGAFDPLNVHTAAADALLDRADGIETGVTPRGAWRLALASLAGKLSGAEGTTVSIRNVPDTKTRITATVDANGNRTAVTTDLT